MSERIEDRARRAMAEAAAERERADRALGWVGGLCAALGWVLVAVALMIGGDAVDALALTGVGLAVVGIILVVARQVGRRWM